MIKLIRYCVAYFKKTPVLQVATINSLAPKVLNQPEDLAKIQPYLDALKKTINDRDITNIALTGGYGSGKSTIIKTFQSLHGEYKYLNLSLASFKDVNEEAAGADGEKGKNLERQLEVSILQQIFYHVKPSEIPDSRFKRINNITTGKIWFFAISLIMWVASTLILFKSGYISRLNPETWDTKKKFDFFAPFPFIIFFTGVGLFAKTVIRLFSNSKINKFTIKGELELGDNIDKSVFNEHLEEIIYFFERTLYNVVVIEDLDRFESTDIFTKLREINILLNNSASVGREINFIYAIKDEMFTDKSERVKFFEYIIPVIPFINPSNAGEQMTRLIKDASLEGVLSKEFTEDVVTFIDDIDMRLLTNIFHEYQLYRSNLNDDLNQDELFAMITYKNLFPDDFGDLHKRKGKLYKLVTNKQKYLKDLLSDNRKKIKSLENEIEDIGKEQIDNLVELRKIYVFEYFTQAPEAASLIVNGDSLKMAELIKEENFNSIKESSHIRYQFFQNRYSNDYYTSNANVVLPFSKVENAVDENFTYEQRVKFINDRITNRQNLLKDEIQKLRNNIIDVDSWSLKKIFEVVDIDPYLMDFADNYLIRNLLLNGYLNENYSDYISLFHAINLTKEDNAFLRHVKSGMSSPFDFKLTQLENLYKRISIKYFSRSFVLNFDLLDYMAENYETCREAYDSVITQLSTGKEKQITFIDAYLNNRQGQISLFVQKICRDFKGFWNEIVHTGNFPLEKKDKYLLWIFQHADVKDVNELGPNFIQYLEEHADVIKLLQLLDFSKNKQILNLLNVKIEFLTSSSELSHDMFDHFYSNNYYRLNAQNIFNIVKDKGLVFDAQHLDNANYSAVYNSGCTPLITYVEENLELYVKTLVLRSGNHEELETSIITMLNHEKITEGTKVAIINSQKALIEDLSNIENQFIRSILLEENRVKISWENIFCYYHSLVEKGINETLLDCLNQEDVYKSLSKQNIKSVKSYDKDSIKIFFATITCCNDLLIEAYSTLMRSYGLRWINISFKDLDKEKVNFLISEKLIGFNTEDYTTLRDNFKTEYFHVLLAENNQSDFLKAIAKITIEKTEVTQLLQSKKCDYITKAKLIEYIKENNENLIIDNPTIAKMVCQIMPQVPYMPISLTLLDGLFKSSTSLEDRIKVLIMQANNYSDNEITEFIKRLGGDYKDLFKKQYKPTFAITEYHRQLFEILRNRSLIRNYDIDAKQSNRLRVIANY
jgi:hypothetical protein